MDRDHPLSRFPSDYQGRGLEVYEDHFDHWAGEPFRVEATTHYMYQATARKVLAAVRLLLLVIFSFREPARRLYSAFTFGTQKLGSMKESLTFPALVDAVLAGDGDSVRTHARAESSGILLSRALEYSCYVRYLEAWETAVGRDRIHLVLFEKLTSRPLEVMQDLSTSIGIDPAFYDQYDFPLRNRTYRVRSGRLQWWARRIGRGIAPFPGLQSWLRSLYFRVQTADSRADPSADDQDAMARFARSLAECNGQLGARYGLDVSAWNQEEFGSTAGRPLGA